MSIHFLQLPVGECDIGECDIGSGGFSRSIEVLYILIRHMVALVRIYLRRRYMPILQHFGVYRVTFELRLILFRSGPRNLSGYVSLGCFLCLLHDNVCEEEGDFSFERNCVLRRWESKTLK